MAKTQAKVDYGTPLETLEVSNYQRSAPFGFIRVYAVRHPDLPFIVTWQLNGSDGTQDYPELLQAQFRYQKQAREWAAQLAQDI